jgi:hypothetical protein
MSSPELQLKRLGTNMLCNKKTNLKKPNLILLCCWLLISWLVQVIGAQAALPLMPSKNRAKPNLGGPGVIHTNHDIKGIACNGPSNGIRLNYFGAGDPL